MIEGLNYFVGHIFPPLFTTFALIYASFKAYQTYKETSEQPQAV